MKKSYLNSFYKTLPAAVMIVTLALTAQCNGNGRPAADGETQETVDIIQDGEEPTVDLNGAYISEVEGIRILHLYGSDQQRGYAHGYLLAEEIIDILQGYLFDYALSELTDMDYATVRTLLQDHAIWPESTMTELNAALQGLRDKLPESQRLVTVPGEGTREVELIDFMAGSVFGDWTRVGGCSGFAAWGDATGGPTIHARHLDYPSGNGVVLPHLIIIAYTPDEGPQWVSASFGGSAGCSTCMNEYGLTMEGNNGGTGLPPSHTTGIIGRSILSGMAIINFGEGLDPFPDLLSLFREHWIYVTQAALYASPYGAGKEDDQVAAVFEVDGNDFENGTTHRAPSETAVSGIDRTDVIIMTNHFQKRVTPPSTGDSRERYLEIWRRIQAALDPADAENPSGDSIIDTEDAHWIMEGVQRNHTMIFAIFEPDLLRIHVAFQKQEGVAATSETPVTLTWDVLFP